jgi:cytochrome P450
VDGIYFRAQEDGVIIGIDYMQHDPVQWQKPHEFIPERFDPESSYYSRPDGGARHPYAFGPFLGGSRICLGKSFAELMVRFTISTIMFHYEIRLTDEKQINDKPAMNIFGSKAVHI